MLKKIATFILLGCIFLLFFNAWLYHQQPSMIFYPYTHLTSTPDDWDISYEDVLLRTSDDVQLHGWYLPSKSSEQVVLFFHGNAGNISHRGESLRIFHELGFNVLIFDYRGYGQSEGESSEHGFYLDALAAWNYLIRERKYKPEQVILFGRSLGGAVATNLATQVNERALILESTFSSANDMAAMMMPVISRLVYLRYDFNIEKNISQINSPLLLMHSQDDEIVPYRLAEKIFNAAKSPKYFFELNGDHNSGFLQNVANYKQAIEWFIENN